MAISKIKLPNDTYQDVKDARLPNVTTNNAGKALVVDSSGKWGVGLPMGIYAYDESRIITNASNPLYRYKICGINRRGTLVPLTITDQTTSTIVDKTPASTNIDPQRGLVYYAGTDNFTSVNNSIGNLYYERSRIDARYTFNTDLPTLREVYLKGTYADHAFSLDTTSHTSWYVVAQLATTVVSQFTASFVSGCYYMYVGTIGWTANMLHLAFNNPLYYFDGSYLIQVNLDSRIDDTIGDIETLINAL